LIFQAKFLVQTQDVMDQIGHEAKGFENLSIEFQSGVKKALHLLKILIGRDATDVAQKFSDTFFAMEPESFARLMKLFSDLSWVKNWQIDKKLMPYETKSAKGSSTHGKTNPQTIEKHKEDQSTKSISQIQRSAMLAVILLVLFLLIDPPVTVLGWILSLGIAALLAYIVIQILFLTRNPNSH
jgi:hypothetical protein